MSDSDSPELQSLLARIPEDPSAAFALADYLEAQKDSSRGLEGELLRLVYGLTRSIGGEGRAAQEERLRTLLKQGVQPLGPRRQVELGDGVALEFAWIPPGVFLMGSPEDEEGRLDEYSPDEPDLPHRVDDADLPQHEVTLTSGFWLGITPVTQIQFAKVTGYNPSWNSDRTADVEARNRDIPVQELEFPEAIAFLEKLAELVGGEGQRPVFRLPTEAEWEFACRAGTTTRYWSGDDEADLAWAGWYEANSINPLALRGTYEYGPNLQPVGQKPANAFGLHDMHGNVWQWCVDWYDEQSRPPTPKTNPCSDDPTSNWRVIRGGDAWDDANNCRSASRETMTPDASHNDLGFRVVAERLA